MFQRVENSPSFRFSRQRQVMTHITIGSAAKDLQTIDDQDPVFQYLFIALNFSCVH